MKPLFTIHEGEFLVGDRIIRKFGNQYDVWVPAKDSGVDLLVTPTSGTGKPVKLQVKSSWGFDPRFVPANDLWVWGWYTLKPAKIKLIPFDFNVPKHTKHSHLSVPDIKSSPKANF